MDNYELNILLTAADVALFASTGTNICLSNDESMTDQVVWLAFSPLLETPASEIDIEDDSPTLSWLINWQQEDYSFYASLQDIATGDIIRKSYQADAIEDVVCDFNGEVFSEEKILEDPDKLVEANTPSADGASFNLRNTSGKYPLAFGIARGLFFNGNAKVNQQMCSEGTIASFNAMPLNFGQSIDPNEPIIVDPPVLEAKDETIKEVIEKEFGEEIFSSKFESNISEQTTTNSAQKEDDLDPADDQPQIVSLTVGNNFTIYAAPLFSSGQVVVPIPTALPLAFSTDTPSISVQYDQQTQAFILAPSTPAS